MLFYIAGKRTDKSTVESGFRTSFENNQLRQSFANNYGGIYTDYFIYSVDESMVDAERIRNAEEFDAVWEGEDIIGISFNKEDAYKVLRFQVKDITGVNNDTLIADGVDNLIISVSVWNPGLVDIDTSFNEMILLPLTDPDNRRAFVKLQLVNGLASKEFKTTKYGIWNIPNNYKFEGVNLKTTNEMVLDINALMDL
jgi:hypothetical protein